MTATRPGRWTSALALLVTFVLAACSQGQAATSTALPPSPTQEPPPATRPSVPSPLPATQLPTPAPSALPTNTLAVTAAAQASPSATPDPALETILAYLQARAKADVAQVTGLACAAWRSQAVTEAISFRSMNAKLDGVDCSVTGTDGPYTLVACRGKIITTYGNESREWDLSTFVYQAASEDGQWKMCGYH